ncbi:MAG: tRNA pseudouridine(54/55) synthase Pus10 [archaeon]
MEMMDSSRQILKKGYVCDNCLGRQFAQLLSGCTNKERGRAIRLVLAMEAENKDNCIDPSNFVGINFRNKKIEPKKTACYVCDGLFDSLPKITLKILKEIKDLEYETFHIGVRLSEKLLNNEEALWDASGIESTESIKKELARETGKLVSKKTKKEVDLKNPDIVVLLNLDRNAIEVAINSFFIYGRYKKYAKIPQTKHYCPDCHGSGCDRCAWRGLTYTTSVQQLAGEPLLCATEGIDTKFHGQGREDVDVLCLGWRPFVIEVLEPRKRNLDLKKLQKDINASSKNQIEVDGLRCSDKSEVQNIKSTHPDKTYLLRLKTAKPIKKTDLKKLDQLVGTIIQKTPDRVKHRRADIERKRAVYSVRYSLEKDGHLKVELKTQAGLYIKELATGDSNRTNPSIAKLLETDIEVVDLTVLNVE